MIFAYTRVSTKEQNEARQIIAINEYAKRKGLSVERYFIDKSQSDNFVRDEYMKMKALLRKGDQLIIKELDRLGRNYDEIKREYAELVQLGVDITILDFPVLEDVNDPALKKLLNDLFLQILAYVAEREKVNIKRRVKEGMQRAKAEGKKVGRPPLTLPKNFDRYYEKVRNGEISIVEFSKLLGKSRSQVYRYIDYYKEQRIEEQLDIEGSWIPLKEGEPVKKRYK